MRGFGGRRRGAGARPDKGARQAVAARPRDAALGRATRGLIGPGSGGRGPRRLATRFAASGLARRRIGRIVTPGRAGGLLGMLAAGILFSFLTGPTAFAVTRTELSVLRWANPAAVAEALAPGEGANLFRLDTAPLEAALEALPAIASADVRVGLPEGALVVTVREREAILAWQAGETRYLADRDGVLFATLPEAADLPAGLALVQDRRAGAADETAIGDRVDAVDLDVATRLGSLTPADIGSAASRLRVRITEGDGFVVLADGGWTAVFGFYSPATRPTDMIPGQVRVLRSLLADLREETLAKIILASETSGTYVPRATPK